MTTPSPERRRLQFGLRKLLLWTIAVAVLLAAMRMLEFETAGFVIVLFGMTILGVLRFLFEPFYARMLWILVVAVAGVVVAVDTALALTDAYSLSLVELVINIIWLSFWGFVLGFGIGGMTYTLADAACRVVAWLDSRMQSSDGS